MKGTICTSQKCPVCGGVLKFDENRRGLFCENHPHQRATGKFYIRFGRDHTKRFSNDFEAALRHLVGLRFKTDEGTYDVRDYQKSAPLAFENLVAKYVEYRKQTDIGKSQLGAIDYTLRLASEEWQGVNIKDIGEGEIEDFLYRDKAISKKTRHNRKSDLTSFWKWVVRREKRKSGLEMPAFPEISYTLGFKTVTDMDTQVKIIEEVKRITYDFNPRIWLGVLLLSFYTKIRPGELISIQEGNIRTAENLIIIPHPKEKKPKYVQISPKHSQLIDEHRHPRGLDHMYFFRHITTRRGTKAGEKFGRQVLANWWKKACENLEIEGVTLYPGTKHTTVTALGQVLTPEQIQRGGTFHASKAFQRYLIPSQNEADMVTDEVFKLKEKSEGKVLKFKEKEANEE